MSKNETAPTGKMARPLDPSVDPWEQQPSESAIAYQAFLEFRDSEDRKVSRQDVLTSSVAQRKRWSALWAWSFRSRAWDRHLAMKEADELIRYRMSMNRRHRDIARVAQNKFVQWLATKTPEDIQKWKPMEAVRVWEVATRIEREASGAALPSEVEGEGVDGVGDVIPENELPLAQMFDRDPQARSELAQAVYAAVQKLR